MRTIIKCLALLGCGAIGCGPSAEGEAGEMPGQADANVDAGHVVPRNDAGNPSSDAAGNSSSDAEQGDAQNHASNKGCDGAGDDLPDDEGTDTNCDGADGVVGKDVYVDLAAGLPTSPGTPSESLRSIDVALALAATRGGHVLLMAGTYTVEKIAQPGAWSIYGGYAKGFSTAPKRDATILEVESTGLFIDHAETYPYGVARRDRTVARV